MVLGFLLAFKAGYGLRGLWWGIDTGVVVTGALPLPCAAAAVPSLQAAAAAHLPSLQAAAAAAPCCMQSR